MKETQISNTCGVNVTKSVLHILDVVNYLRDVNALVSGFLKKRISTATTT